MFILKADIYKKNWTLVGSMLSPTAATLIYYKHNSLSSFLSSPLSVIKAGVAVTYSEGIQFESRPGNRLS
jgi:hypothetical protein